MGKIYVICPSHIVSGGPDALHQIVFYLKKIGLDAVLVYSDINKKRYTIPAQYQEYVQSYSLISEIEDKEENAIVVPETLNFYRHQFKNVSFFIWWMGIGSNSQEKKKYFLNKLKFKTLLKFLKKHNKFRNLLNYLKYKRYDFVDEDPRINHLCASYYTFDYVTKKTTNPHYLCIEPVSIQFLRKSKVDYSTHTSNVILYNPARNNAFIQEVIKKAEGLEFLALTGFKQDELFDIYWKSKLYIDFGAFPGAERIPKEAVLNGCMVLLAKRGAASFYGDFPIDDEYKIVDPEDDVDFIINKIKEMLSNYDSIVPSFCKYRETILNLEANFIHSLKSIFLKEQNKL